MNGSVPPPTAPQTLGSSEKRGFWAAGVPAEVYPQESTLEVSNDAEHLFVGSVRIDSLYMYWNVLYFALGRFEK